MEKDDKGSTMIRMGVSGWMFLLVPAYPGCPGSKAVKRSLLLLLFLDAPTEQFTVRLTSRAQFLDENRDQLTDTQMRLRPTPQAGRLRPFGLKVSQFVAILVLKSTRVLCRPDSVLFHMSVWKQCTNLYKWANLSATTPCPKKRPPFIFLNNSVKK